VECEKQFLIITNSVHMA